MFAPRNFFLALFLEHGTVGEPFVARLRHTSASDRSSIFSSSSLLSRALLLLKVFFPSLSNSPRFLPSPDDWKINPGPFTGFLIFPGPPFGADARHGGAIIREHFSPVGELFFPSGSPFLEAREKDEDSRFRYGLRRSIVRFLKHRFLVVTFSSRLLVASATSMCFSSTFRKKQSRSLLAVLLCQKTIVRRPAVFQLPRFRHAFRPITFPSRSRPPMGLGALGHRT